MPALAALNKSNHYEYEITSQCENYVCPLDIFGEKDAEAGQIWMSHFHPHHLDRLVQFDLEPGVALLGSNEETRQHVCCGHSVINKMAMAIKTRQDFG